MRAAADDTDFAAAPLGAYLATPRFVYFCARRDLCGVALWGRPDGDDLRRLERLLLVALAPGLPRHGCLVDAGRVDGVDAAAVGALGARVRVHHEALARQVERIAVVRPPGLPGATVTRLFRIDDAPSPIELVPDAHAGLRRLGEADDGLATALEALIADAAGLAPLLVELRRVLDAGLGRLPLEGAALALGLSPQALLRQLGDAGATYGGEVGGAQVRAAQRLLLDSNLQVTEIALEVGCATPQQFAALFRRRVGESPSSWRDRQRRAAP